MAIFHGTNGNDSFTGTPGISDTVTFAGNAAGYEIALTANGKIQVRDIDFSNGNTGVDTLTNIDLLSFADRTFSMTSTTETEVSTYDDGSEHENYSPEAITLADGSYVIMYTNTAYGPSDDGVVSVYGRRFDKNGSPVGTGFEISNANRDAYGGDLGALADGGYVATWSEGGDVFARRYDASNNEVGGKTAINTTTADSQSGPFVIGLAGGGYVATWQSDLQDGSGYGIYAQRFDAAGDKAGGETRVNTTTANWQYAPVMTALADGGYLAVWQSTGQDGSGDGIYAQRFDATGNAEGGETRVNTKTANNQSEANVATLENGSYVVTWTSANQDGSHTGVYAQRFDAAGNKMGGETRVNTHTNSYQDGSDVVALADGGYLVAWHSTGQVGQLSIHAQRFDAEGNTVGGETLIEGHLQSYYPDVSITAMANGGFVVAWHATGKGTSYIDVFSRCYNANGELMVQTMAVDGTGGDDILNGGIGSQTLRGLTGHDTISGGSNRDILLGARGKDTLDGGQGYDDLHGGAGIDSLSGGLGVDAFIFDTLVDGLNYDIVRDFTKADVIELDNAVFAKLTATGALNANFFRANANGEALDADDYILYNTNSGQLFYDVDGTGAAGGKVLFAFVGTAVHPTMTAADFEVI